MSGTQEDIYKEYLNYDWDSFREFQDGLREILDNYLKNLQENDATISSISPHDKQQLIDQAKSFFYCSNSGNIMNLDEFKAWEKENGDKYRRSKQIVELEEPDQIQSSNDTENMESTAPYSSNYHELVERIITGKEIPGIKQIPDTVLPEKSSQSHAKLRVKPWEQKEVNKDIS
ncbi:uncharacterized protein PRCAT00000547001 [Priceomyces carsonii]|uniref:uncharacterized protein n=1 Tax=Priceomyces carsonii TaxID=28549 RepID=UPI002EDB06B0|nr:unnamed protein product [Priceomyces carsonii]